MIGQQRSGLTLDGYIDYEQLVEYRGSERAASDHSKGIGNKGDPCGRSAYVAVPVV